MPLGSWFKGPLREMLHDCVLSERALSRGIVSERFVRELVAEHQSGRRDNADWLYALLMLEMWLFGWTRLFDDASLARHSCSKCSGRMGWSPQNTCARACE